MIKWEGKGKFSNYVAKLGTVLQIFLIFPYVPYLRRFLILMTMIGKGHGSLSN
jgi:hypothetical protein